MSITVPLRNTVETFGNWRLDDDGLLYTPDDYWIAADRLGEQRRGTKGVSGCAMHAAEGFKHRKKRPKCRKSRFSKMVGSVTGIVTRYSTDQNDALICRFSNRAAFEQSIGFATVSGLA
jgi:hypothetical protein